METSIVYSAKLDGVSHRIDAEYYMINYLILEDRLSKNQWDYLGNFSNSIRSFGAYSLCNLINYKESGVPFIRCKDIYDGAIHLSDVLYIDENVHKILWKSEVNPETVLFTMSGTVGNSAVANKNIAYPINSNQDVAKIKTNNRINPYYLSTYLNSKYGKSQSKRIPIGSIQTHIFLWQLEKILIPIFNISFQKFIEKLSLLSACKNDFSIQFFEKAQHLLLCDLKIYDNVLNRSFCFSQRLSDVVFNSRWDAEYYQPIYDDLEKIIKEYKGGWEHLGKIIKINEANFNPENNKLYHYIELANISPRGEINGYSERLGNELPSRARRKVNAGDVIISSIEGSLANIALINRNEKNLLCSTGFHVIRSDYINPETLLMFFKSIAGQMQLKKRCSGTILSAISTDEFKNILIPKIREEIQEEIKTSVTSMYQVRQQSRSLLEIAKTGVEKAIEEDEETAMDWMNGELERCGISLDV